MELVSTYRTNTFPAVVVVIMLVIAIRHGFTPYIIEWINSIQFMSYLYHKFKCPSTEILKKFAIFQAPQICQRTLNGLNFHSIYVCMIP